MLGSGEQRLRILLRYGHRERQTLVAATRKPIRISDRVNRLPRWAQDYTMRVVGAEKVEELVFLRDQNKALVKLVGELKLKSATAEKRFPNPVLWR